MSTREELDATIIHEALWGEAPGSGPAFARLYEHYELRVRYAVARAAHSCGYRHRIDELRQDVWVRLLDRDRKLLRYYRPEAGPLGPFLARIAYQQALAAIRVERRQGLAHGRSPFVVADEVIDDKTSRTVAMLVQSDLYAKLMARAAEELDELDALVLREVHLNQRRCREVALEYGLKPDRLYKRNERLKKKLSEWGEALLADIEPGSSPSLRPSALVAMLVAGLTASSGALEPSHVHRRSPESEHV